MENKEINPQEKVNNKSLFVEKEIPTPKKEESANTKPPVKKINSGSIYLWIFFGFVLLVFIGLLVMSVYMLQTPGGQRIFETFGISTDSATLVLRNIINSVYILFSLLIVIMLLIGAGILASADKKSPIRSTGIRSVSFSMIFLFILSISYIALFPILYKDQIEKNINMDYSKYITVNPDPPQGSAPLRVFVDATKIDESNENLFFEWDFGDDSVPATGPKTSHEYQTPGIYSIKLTASNAETKEEINPNITVLIHNTSAIPRIKSDVTQGKAPLEVYFDAGTSEDPNGEIIEYLWNFDDPESGNNQARGIEAIHTYTEEGSYEVTLTIKDETQETRSITQTILVTSDSTGIQPKIVASPTRGSAPLKVNFNATGSTHTDSDQTLTSFEWDFGDGTPLVRSREISHTFSENGIYNVILSITDSNDNKVQETVEIEVTDQLVNPEAKIISEPAVLVGEAPFTVNLNANASIDLDGEVITYNWSFGDKSPEMSGPQVTHTYEEVGQYTIKLEVEDNDNKKGITTSVVTVKEPAPNAPSIELTTDPSPAQGNLPLVITFDASNSTDSDGDIISYEWDFGDGSKKIQTIEPQTTHKYQQVGIWPVVLTVYDNDGLTTSKNMKVAVTTVAPEAEFSVSKESAFAPADIVFDASDSAGDIVNYSWNFDDGSSDTGLVVNHLFKNSGNYTVVLNVEDAQGQVDTKSMTIKIN